MLMLPKGGGYYRSLRFHVIIAVTNRRVESQMKIIFKVVLWVVLFIITGLATKIYAQKRDNPPASPPVILTNSNHSPPPKNQRKSAPTALSGFYLVSLGTKRLPYIYHNELFFQS